MAQVAIATIEGIFHDEAVSAVLSAAKQLRTINGPPPDELLQRMKSGLGKHIKKNGYGYTRKLEREIAQISRIRERQVGIDARIRRWPGWEYGRSMLAWPDATRLALMSRL